MARQSLINTADDMRWLREVHLPKLPAKYKAAIIVGNEDYPDRIEVYERRDPKTTDVPIVFKAGDDDVFRETSRTHHSTMKTTKTSKMLSSPVVLSERVAMPTGLATIHIHHGKGGYAGVLVLANGNELPMSLGVPAPTTAREALRGAKKFLVSVYGKSN